MTPRVWAWAIASGALLVGGLLCIPGRVRDRNDARAARLAVDSARLITLTASRDSARTALARAESRAGSAIATWDTVRLRGPVRWRRDTVPGGVDTVRVAVPLESLPPTQVLAYARRLEGAGDALQRSCSALRDSSRTYRSACEAVQATLTRNRDDWRSRAIDAERANRPFSLGVTGGYAALHDGRRWHDGWGATAGLTYRVRLRWPF